jgi:hypothetical protein
MRKQSGVVVLVMLLFAGMGSATLVTRALAQSKSLSAVQQERRLGPKPTPRWFWHWQAWRLGEGYAKGHRLERDFRPRNAPRHVPRWAWERLHFFLLARGDALSKKGHGPSHTTTTATTATTTTTTTTQSTVTSTTTTATTTTTSGSGDPTYDSEIAYTQSPPAFTPSRTIDVSSGSELKTALANLQAGDLVKATTSFTVSGETIIGNRLSAPAELDLTGVTFDYGGGANVPAVYLNDPSNLRIFGGTATTEKTGGFCIVAHGAQHVLWWGFYVHDCGNSGVYLATIQAPFTDNDFQGEITRAGLNLNWDPHAEKGTGLHAALLWDSSTYTYDYSGNRFAFYIHDQPSGAGISYGSGAAAPNMAGNVIIEKAANLTDVALSQCGGNGLQFWGAGGYGVDVKYLEVNTAEGRALDAVGTWSSNLQGVKLEYGRASNTNLNTQMNESSPTLPWDIWHGIVYQDATPTP